MAPGGRAQGRAVIATTHPTATQVGLEILKRGGTAVDAALAASFTLGVVEPFHSGIGGGGFLLLFLARERRVVAVDARGVAPASATENMYVKSGAVCWQDTVIGHRSVLVPGLLSGLGLVYRLAGSMPMAELLAPAAAIAEAGFPVSPIMAHLCNNAITRDALSRNPEASRVYMPLGRIPQVGEQLRNPDLAQSYRMIGQEGPEVFYRGRLASRIAEDMAANGGNITKEDLATYRARIVDPAIGTYRGLQVHTMPPPSSGGIFLLHCLNVLEGYELGGMTRYSPAVLHLLSEAMKCAFADRAHYVGDPRFVDVPVRALTSKEYAGERRRLIKSDVALRAPTHGEINTFGEEGGQTTHLCVADECGNVVGITQSIGSNLASGVMPPGTGIVLNHLMSDFSPAVGVTTTLGWGAYTSRANAIAPGKSPASSQTPVLVFRGEEFVLAAGAAGGSRIPTTVLQSVLNVVDFGMDIQEAISAPRVHDQGGGLEIEQGIPEAARPPLAHMGHEITLSSGYRESMPSWAQGVARRGRNLFDAGADPRADGSATGI